MKILSFSISNFGSYRKLSFDVADNGLCLIYGPTGSGKSTFQDAPCWVLYGVTAKDGSVDEIKSWQGTGATKGIVELELENGAITVVRTRGTSHQNDLYFTEINDKIVRGKDITETQVLLEKRIGVKKDVYIAGCYFHEFSSSGSFFTDKAKDRRALFERIASLELMKTITDNAVIKIKELKKSYEFEEIKLSNAKSRASVLKNELNSTSINAKQWNSMQVAKIVEYTRKYKEFDRIKSAKIADLTALAEKHDAEQIEMRLAAVEKMQILKKQLAVSSIAKCVTCGRSDADSNTGVIEYQIKQLTNIKAQSNPYTGMLDQATKQDNHYGEQIAQASAEQNPLSSEFNRLEAKVNEIISQIHRTEVILDRIDQEKDDLELVRDIAVGVRGQILEDSVKQIQMTTNEYLNTYFEAEIKVDFKLEKTDDLKVSIQKSGYDCVYSQLSKGQRGLLKLCFAVAIMKATSERAGVHFEQLFFDESLDGLDADMKIKAFSLFKGLNIDHKSIYLIDHASEFQNMFEKKYQVKLVGDLSEIEEVTGD